MLTFAFAMGTAALILQSVLCPHFTLLAFAPWIALVSLSRPFIKTLWLSAAAGAVIDLISDDPMGVHALNYCLTAALLFRYKKHFLHDNPLHLCLYSALVSLSSTLIQIFLLFLFDRRVPFAGKWVLGDLVGMPIADGIYALVWFAAPLILYNKLRRHWSFYWRNIKQSLFPT
jgi:rod shape-determining protein MreD